MSRAGTVISRATPLVVPSSREVAKIDSMAKSILSRTENAAARFPQTRGVLLGGSFAKGTWLPHHVDLDVFVRIDPATTNEEFERIGLSIGEAATRGYPAGKKFAQHPYTEATVEGVRVNVVPCFDVKRGEWKSAADRSPYHVKLVEVLPEEQKTQIRLLKLFLNAIGVYGAEIQAQGFSGYVAEVLVMKFGSVEATLEWFAKYKMPLGKIFSLPDPVDEKRDLGIAVSGESLGRMLLASREFLKRPSLAFFRKMSGKGHPPLRDEVVAILFSHKSLSEDTLWGELRKTTKHVVRHLEVFGFSVARSMAASDNKTSSAILLVPEISQLPALEQRSGPTLDRRGDVEAFLSANSKNTRLIWVDAEARVRMLLPRKYTSLDQILNNIVRGKAGKIGASKELDAGMKKSARVLRGRSLAHAASSTNWLRDGIEEITADAVGTR